MDSANDHQEGFDDDLDRKPPARSRVELENGEAYLENGLSNDRNGMGTDSSDHDDASDDHDDSESSSNVDDGEGRKPVAVGEDGRELSEYELLRLERIKRNRQVLAQLGLGGEGGGGILGRKDTDSLTKRRSSKKDSLPTEKRASLRAKKDVSYTEPKRGHLTKSLKIEESLAENRAEPKEATRKNPRRKSKDSKGRMDKLIYLEFKRIRAHQAHSLRQAEKDARTAEKEVKYWGKRVRIWDRRKERRRELERIQNQLREAQTHLGGTLKQLLQEVDRRMPELLAAANRYDDVYQFLSPWKAAAKAQDLEEHRAQVEQRMKLLDALERFPKFLKDSMSVLTTELVQRAPKDRPPPRRSKRVPLSEELSTTQNNSKLNGLTTGKRNETGQWKEDLELSDVGVDSAHDDARHQKHAGSKRKNARVVGGWISPQFAESIDRSWLESDTYTPNVDPSFYVPQVDDTVLYFVAGHRSFLEEYPDVLAKKTRSVKRVPLWERASAEKAESELPTDTVTSSTSRWWTDEWVQRLDSQLENYPLICQVVRAHAEFPPDDPFSKVVKRTDDPRNGTKVYWNPPKKTPILGSIRGAPLRLAVTLRPLTPLMPSSSNDSTDDHGARLLIPPTFSVVTFPSKLKPFILPFSWAYAASHGFSLNDWVFTRNDANSKLRVCELSSLGEHFGTMRLDDKVAEIRRLLALFNTYPSRRAAIKAETENSPIKLPLKDMHQLVQFFSQFVDRVDAAATDCKPDCSMNLINLIRSTLPLWNGVTLTRNAYNRKKAVFSPWEVVPSGKLDHSIINPAVNDPAFSIDEGLRAKLECVIKRFVTENSSADLFFAPVTEDVAPSYGCAVPVSMSLSKIMMRLQCDGSSLRCYYNNVASLLADVTTIMDNCLLYNSPESSIVDDALDVTSELKNALAKTSQSHYQELSEARNADEERRRLALTGTNDAGEYKDSDNANSRLPLITTIKFPFPDKIALEWLQATNPASPSSTESSDGDSEWVPQAGDSVLYSRSLHSRFVEYHYPSLEAHQCLILSSGSVSQESTVESESSRRNSVDSTADWETGKVSWTRACFPKALSKRSAEDANTFPTSASLLAIAIKFPASGIEGIVHWRPCVFHLDRNSNGCCPTCGNARKSFLRPVEPTIRDVESDEFELIDCCIRVLKKRCLKRIPPGTIDDQLTKENVKAGYKPSVLKISTRSLPSFELLFSNERRSVPIGTRGVLLKSLEKDNAHIDALKDVGFLPAWVSSSSGKADIEILSRCERVVPLPKLCLELIHQRLRQSYYRHRASIANDIVESFVTIFVLVLAEAAGRRSGSVSMKKIARSLATTKSSAVRPHISEEEHHALEFEEQELVDRLRPILELYSMALASVTDTSLVSCLLGVSYPDSNKVVAQTAVKPAQDPARAAAREKLAFVLSALGRDQLLNIFGNRSSMGYLPSMKLKVICNNAIVSYRKLVTVQTCVTALTHVGEIKVKVICDKKPVTVRKTIGQARATQTTANGEAKLVSEKFIDVAPDDYENRDQLAKFFFRRPGRMGTCARCQVYRRSFVACRVRRAHSNIDFDWVESFRGLGGVDGLLRTLFPDHQPPVMPVDSISVSKSVVATTDNGAPSSSRPHTDGYKALQTDDAEDGDDEVESEDPRPLADKAGAALLLARKIYEDARRYAQAPTRLSKQFIETTIPIDASDGHYVYCIVCGLSGDLLCCDSCPTVVHRECISLNDVPDGDWFCEECTVANQGRDEEQTEKAAALPANNKKLPFGRVEFDEAAADKLASMLDCLRQARPADHKKRKFNDDDAESMFDDSTRSRRHKRYFIGDSYDEPGRRRENTEISIDFGLSGTQKRTRRPSNHPISDPFEALTATARKCLASMGVRTAEHFLSERSKDVASAYVKWREKYGLPVLKGVGANASVSAWKTQVRNAANDMGLYDVARIEPNYSEANQDPGEEDAGEANQDPGEEDAGEANQDPGHEAAGEADQDPRHEDAGSATQSEIHGASNPAATKARDESSWNDGSQKRPRPAVDEVPNPLDALSATTRRFLSDIGITTAESFLTHTTFELGAKLSDWRKMEGMAKLKGTGSIASISAWKTLCRNSAAQQGLNDIAALQPADAKRSPSASRVASEDRRSPRGLVVETAASSGVRSRSSPRPRHEATAVGGRSRPQTAGQETEQHSNGSKVDGRKRRHADYEGHTPKSNGVFLAKGRQVVTNEPVRIFDVFVNEPPGNVTQVMNMRHSLGREHDDQEKLSKLSRFEPQGISMSPSQISRSKRVSKPPDRFGATSAHH